MSNFKMKRIRDAKYLAIIRDMLCHVQQDDEHCNGSPVDAHHLTCIEGEGIMGAKAGDDKVLPLCRLHHRTLHNISEKAFWSNWGLDAESEAKRLWDNYRGGRING